MSFSFCFFFTLGVVGEGEVSVQVFSRQAWSFLTDLVYEIPEKIKPEPLGKKKERNKIPTVVKQSFCMNPFTAYC